MIAALLAVAAIQVTLLQIVPFMDRRPPTAVVGLRDGSAAVIAGSPHELYRVTAGGAISPLNEQNDGPVQFDDAIAAWNGAIATIRDERMTKVDENGHILFRTVPDPKKASSNLAVDRDGTVWTLNDGRLWGMWMAMALPTPAYRLFTGQDGRAYAVLDDGSLVVLSDLPWRASPVAAARRDARGVGPDGSIWFADETSVIHIHPDGRSVPIVLAKRSRVASGRPLDVQIQVGADGTAWCYATRFGGLVRITPDDRAARVLLPVLPNDSGKWYAVAGDGSLWYLPQRAAALVHVDANRTGAEAPLATSTWRFPSDHRRVRALVPHGRGYPYLLTDDALGADPAPQLWDGDYPVASPARAIAAGPGDAVWVLDAKGRTLVLNRPNGSFESTHLKRPVQSFAADLAGRPWTIDEGDATLSKLRAGADGQMYASAFDFGVYRMHRDRRAERVASGIGDDFAVARDGTLWYLRGSAIYHRDAAGKTRSVNGLRASSLAAGPDGSVWFAVAGSHSRLCRMQTVFAFACSDLPAELSTGKLFAQRDGSVWFLSPPNTIVRIAPTLADWERYEAQRL